MTRLAVQQPQSQRVSARDLSFRTVVAGLRSLINSNLDSQKRDSLLAAIEVVSRTAGLFLRSMSIHLTLFAMTVLSSSDRFAATGLRNENLFDPLDPHPPPPLIVFTTELIKWCFSIHNTAARNSSSRSGHAAYRQLVASKPEGSEKYDGGNMSHILEAIAKQYSTNTKNYL